jgi:hypothetical protein
VDQASDPTGAKSFYLGTQNAVIDNITGIITLDPTENTYKYDSNGERVNYQLASKQVATNALVIQGLSVMSASGYTLKVTARFNSGIRHTPAKQPVPEVYSIFGQDALTGAVSDSLIHLVHSSDFLLEGGSSRAYDSVNVDTTVSARTSKTVSFATLDKQPIDSGIDTSEGITVLAEDGSVLYKKDVDYRIVPSGRYQSYSIVRVPTGTIPNDKSITVGYNQFKVRERLNFVKDELVTLNSTLWSNLGTMGFVQNVWLPDSYGRTELLYNAGLDNVKRSKRYIKVTLDDVVLQEGSNGDYLLDVDPVSGQASIARLITGKIPDGAIVKVSYFTTEVFQVVTKYPSYVTQLANVIEEKRDAGADVLVKTMMKNRVDVTLAVELTEDASPEVIDSRIRSVLSIVLDNASKKLTQAEIIRQVKAIPGVFSVSVPLTKFARADGSYDVGVIIPTSTNWTQAKTIAKLSSLTDRCFITDPASFKLPNPTLPSGGEKDAFVGMLYQGDSFRRAMSLEDFLNDVSKPVFYIFGKDDPIAPELAGCVLLLPPVGMMPSNYAFRVTYQVFGASGANDIALSATEFLTPGRISISYK